MSKSHSYRIQLHCDKTMHSQINEFSNQRGISQSAAARILIERSLIKNNDQIESRFNKIDEYLESILHASTASRILAADAAKNSGSELSGDELRDKISRLLQRYKQF